MNPIGTITLWSGSIASIPADWVLCDGNNGTPNLMDKFVIGAGDDFNVGADAGEREHTHTAFDEGHNHDVETVDFTGVGVGAEIWHSAADGNEVNTAFAEIVVDETETLPPYYALAYIMRVA